jgi:hypothetical protein
LREKSIEFISGYFGENTSRDHRDAKMIIIENLFGFGKVDYYH